MHYIDVYFYWYCTSIGVEIDGRTWLTVFENCAEEVLDSKRDKVEYT